MVLPAPPAALFAHGRRWRGRSAGATSIRAQKGETAIFGRKTGGDGAIRAGKRPAPPALGFRGLCRPPGWVQWPRAVFNGGASKPCGPRRPSAAMVVMAPPLPGTRGADTRRAADQRCPSFRGLERARRRNSALCLSRARACARTHAHSQIRRARWSQAQLQQPCRWAQRGHARAAEILFIYTRKEYIYIYVYSDSKCWPALISNEHAARPRATEGARSALRRRATLADLPVSFSGWPIWLSRCPSLSHSGRAAAATAVLALSRHSFRAWPWAGPP